MTKARVLIDTKTDFEPDNTNDTLAKIVKEKCPDLTWQELALFNWGTAHPSEVNRFLLEGVGCKTVTDDDPSKSVLDKTLGTGKKIRIPKLWKEKVTVFAKTHTIKVKKIIPPNAISITKLDRWFIPGLETCDIQYRLEGLKERADKVVLEVYGSNYCDCTDWNKGLGTYNKTDDLVTTPLIAQEQSKGNDERKAHTVAVQDPADKTKTGPWKGNVTANKGMLSLKTGNDSRYVNVAFSPYTVHLRYFKDDADKTARIELEPFWLEWEEEKTTPAAVANTANPAAIIVSWTNPADLDRAVLEVKDKNGQSVFLAEVTAAAGAQTHTWNGKYRYEASNSEFADQYLVADGAYSFTITTIKLKPKADSLKAKWKIKNTTRLEAGLIQIFDGNDQIVFQAGQDKAALDSGTFEWKDAGKYTPGIKNSRAKDTAIFADMPYRVQIQAHTPVNQEKGLAIAVMHTEVRLFVHFDNRAPRDLAYTPFTLPSIALKLGAYVPGDPPEEPSWYSSATTRTKWLRYKLAEYGFHPGPVITSSANDAEYKLALKEFKRSVPAKGDAAAGDFKRLTIDDAENRETQTAINTIRNADKRRLFGNPTSVNANADDPDLSDNDITLTLPSPHQEMIVWVDDRQYYTGKSPTDNWTTLDENNNDMLQAPFNLDNHRGHMAIGDNRTVRDAESIPRPWIPLQADLALLSKAETFFGKDSSGAVVDVFGLANDRKDASRRAIGPIRVDWSFDELPPDYSQFDLTGTYRYPDAVASPQQLLYNKDIVRSRTLLRHILDAKKAVHNRPDTLRQATYTNCPGGADPNNIAVATNLGGIRPDNLANYQQQAFGTAELSLQPWPAAPVAATETIATVAHEHLHKDQKDKETLFSSLLGSSGTYFHPSRIAGDGYRVRAEVQFDTFTNYDFPNLPNLKKRYPTPPQAHTAGLRNWRKTSFRGYACWGPATGDFAADFIGVFRTNYRACHVYFVHEHGAATTFNIATLLDQNIFKKVITKNVTEPLIQVEADVTLNNNDIWPWTGQNHFGWPEPLRVDATNNAYSKFINIIINGTWRKFRFALIIRLLQAIEKQGYMKGHLLVQFIHNTACRIRIYDCGNGHRFFCLERDAGPNRLNGQVCPRPGCGQNLAPSADVQNMNGLNLPAVGGPLGATWLYKGSNHFSDKVTWVHEVGHHRHLQHAANAPGASADLHDTQANTVANWALHPKPPNTDPNLALARQWDRTCNMTYSDIEYDELGCFCGKCILINRGWKASPTALAPTGLPGSAVKDP